MLIIDTGFLIAVLDRRDAHHARALAFVHTQPEGWVTTWPVITETLHFLMKRVHLDSALAVLDDVKSGALQVWEIPAEQVTTVQTLMQRYGKLPMDLADASLVLLAEHLGMGHILTTDRRDFGAYRWKSKKPFEDVMALNH